MTESTKSSNYGSLKREGRVFAIQGCLQGKSTSKIQFLGSKIFLISGLVGNMPRDGR